MSYVNLSELLLSLFSHPNHRHAVFSLKSNCTHYSLIIQIHHDLIIWKCERSFVECFSCHKNQLFAKCGASMGYCYPLYFTFPLKHIRQWLHWWSWRIEICLLFSHIPIWTDLRTGDAFLWVINTQILPGPFSIIWSPGTMQQGALV